MSKSVIKASNFTPTKKNVFIVDLESGPRLSHGIIIPDDNMNARGIRPRWCKVWKVGPEVDDILPGEFVYVCHGKWTPGMDMELDEGTLRVWRVDYPESVLLVSEVDPRDSVVMNFNEPVKSTLVQVKKKLHRAV